MFISFLVLLIVNQVFGLVNQCQQFIGANSNSKRFVDSIQDVGNINQSIENSDSLFILLNLINGTKWLNLGGSVDQFEIVLGKPPQTSSALSLNDAINKLKRRWKSRGILLNFHPPELIKSLPKNQQFKNQSIWISYELNDFKKSCELCGQNNINVIWNKKFGLDSIFERFENEDLVLIRNRQRVKKIITDFYQNIIPNDHDKRSDQRFIKNLFEKINSRHPNSFSVLLLEATLELIENEENRYRDFHFLPDLKDVGSFYTLQEIYELLDHLDGFNFDNECLILSLRAGALIKTESLNAIEYLIKEKSNILINAFVEAYDQISDVKLQEISNILGNDKVLFQIPFNEDRTTQLSSNESPLTTPTLVSPTNFADAQLNSHSMKQMPSLFSILKLLSFIYSFNKVLLFL